MAKRAKRKDWQLISDRCDPTRDKHVTPNNDHKRHLLVRSCWCRPHLSDEGEFSIVVHNSLDGREFAEPDHDRDPLRSRVDG